MAAHDRQEVEQAGAVDLRLKSFDANPAIRFATLPVVRTAHFLMPFMMSAVGVALPAIGREFKTTALQLGLVETTYVLSVSIFLLAMGGFSTVRRNFRFLRP